MLARAADAIAEAQPKKVIDLGAGTGALAQAILQRCEGATVELIDADAEMLDQARERLAPFAARVQYTVRAFQGPLPTCDAVVASLALHHVPTLAEKRTVFGAIHAALPLQRRIRQRGCDHARRPLRSPSRIRNLGSPPRLLRHRRGTRL